MIDNESIPFFFKFKNNFPKLKDLNLEGNNLTDYYFFKSIQSLKDLMILNVSRNEFYPPRNPNEKYFFNSMKEMILSNGVFDNNTIKIIQNFEIKNIELINLSSNNLNSLDFINNNIHWEKLSTLLLNANNISKIEKLNKFTGLKKLEIYENPISNIEELKNLKKNIPDLQIYASIIKDYNNINNNNNINNINNNIYERSSKIDSNYDDN